MPFRHTFRDKIKSLVSVALTQKQFHKGMQSWMTPRGVIHDSTIDTHLQAKAI